MKGNLNQEIQQEIGRLIKNAASLTIYQPVLENDVGRAFISTLESILNLEYNSSTVCLKNYSFFLRALVAQEQSWEEFILEQTLLTDNSFTRQVQLTAIENVARDLVKLASHDLRVLQKLYRCSCQQVQQWVMTVADPEVELPIFCVETPPRNKPSLQRSQAKQELKQKLIIVDGWEECLDDFVRYYQRFGSGFSALYNAFRWQSQELVGIQHPDPVRLSELVAYEHQKEELIKNTLSLLEGNPALHVLLYGTRGSGKSSLVKALLNEYSNRGLRLIEVSKSDLQYLPLIVEKLRELPQKFIVFVDDLSFEEDDDTFKALKVVLEGSVTARAKNVVVYATSNRRHLVREFFEDRPRPRDRDEVHPWDSMQEKLSFSDRFGLTLTFEPANQATYLTIVRHLAEQAQLDIDMETLEKKAVLWERRTNGRSGRTARQFIDYLKSELTHT